MCGICGLVATGGGAPDQAALEAMNDTLRHRGPDSAGMVVNGPVGRLARILSAIRPRLRFLVRKMLHHFVKMAVETAFLDGPSSGHGILQRSYRAEESTFDSPNKVHQF